MNKKYRIGLLIVLALLLLLYIFLRYNAPEEKTRRVFDLKPEQITKIEIWDAEDEIEMNLLEGIWKISEPFVWDADSTRISDFFAEVVNAEYATTPVSLGADAPTRYQLTDEAALHMKLSSGRKSVLVLFSNLGNSWDYFRFDGDDKVYQLKNKLVQSYNPQQINWRSKLVFQYYEEDLRKIRSRHESGDFTLTRDGSKWTYQDASDTFEVPYNNFSLVKIISVLQNMQIFILADGRSEVFREAFKEPLCEVWITDTRGETRKLSFAKVDNERHMLMINDDPHVIYQVSFDIVFRFMRHAELFMRELA